MLLVEISTESIYWSKYLCRSVTISLSECDVRSVQYTGHLRGNAVLYWSPAQGRRCGEYATSPGWCGVYVTSPSDEVWRVVWPLIHVWHLALCRARPKYIFLRYRDLAYVSVEEDPDSYLRTISLSLSTNGCSRPISILLFLQISAMHIYFGFTIKVHYCDDRSHVTCFCIFNRLSITTTGFGGCSSDLNWTGLSRR